MAYTNPLIERVMADIAYSRARNAQLSQMTFRPASVSMPSPSRLGLGGISVGGVSPQGVKLATIVSPWGQRVTVNAQYASKFSEFLKGLQQLGYHPKDIQGYNFRNIAGTNTLSQHAKGLAIDVDPLPNRGSRLGSAGPRYGYFNPNLILPLVRRLGMSWGGTWSSPDPMHFSFGEGYS